MTRGQEGEATSAVRHSSGAAGAGAASFGPNGRRLERSSGTVRLAFGLRGDRTVLRDLYQAGAMGARFPRGAGTEDSAAVLINKAGGLTGGDTTDIAVRAGEGTHTCVTTQACEKIYRAESGVVLSEVLLDIEDHASLFWIPQPTILFSGARLDRSFRIECAENAQLFLIEAVILGRSAMGETFEAGCFSDHWRLRSRKTLVFAEEFRFEPSGASAARPSTLNNARVLVTLLYLAPDAETRLEDLRSGLNQISSDSGASFRDGLVHGLVVASTADTLMDDLAEFVEEFLGHPMPRVWTC